MTAEDIRKMSDDQIRQEIADQSDALFRLRFRRQTEQLEDLGELRQTRRNIARLKTILRERELNIPR